MMAVYLFSLIVGGGLLLLSLFGGEGGDLEIDGALDLDGLGDAAELASADAAASKVFSLRSLIYATFGFGGAGALLTYLGAAAATTLVAAVVTGVLSGAMVSAVFGYLRRTDSGAKLGDQALEGLAGHVVLPIDADSPGAVVVVRGDRRLRLRALPHGTVLEGDPSEWDRVVVVEVEGGIARVAPLEEDRLLDS